jgi:hypothetical protein
MQPGCRSTEIEHRPAIVPESGRTKMLRVKAKVLEQRFADFAVLHRA